MLRFLTYFYRPNSHERDYLANLNVEELLSQVLIGLQNLVTPLALVELSRLPLGPGPLSLQALVLHRERGLLDSLNLLLVLLELLRMCIVLPCASLPIEKLTCA